MTLLSQHRTAAVLALLLTVAAATGVAVVPAAGATTALDGGGDDGGETNETLDAVIGASVGDTTSVSLDTATDDALDESTDGALDETVNGTLDGTTGADGGAEATTETTVDADTDGAFGTGVAPLSNVSLVASADGDDGTLVLDAEVDTLVDVGVAANASIAGTSAGAAQQDDSADADDGSDESDDAAASAGSDGGPTPEELGAGAAVGSLLLGGGLFAHRAGALAAISSGSGGTAVSTALGLLKAWGWRLLCLAGYQRWDDSDPLEHEGRAAIYEHLEASPGDFLSEISEETGVALSTLRYHLRILEFENRVTSVEVRGKRRFFPADVDPDALATALDDDATAAVLEALARSPDSVSGLADRLDRDPSTVSHHLQRLDEEGLVERERDGRSVVNRLADGLASEVVASADGRVAGSAD